jgi:dienelactone hydrolase
VLTNSRVKLLARLVPLLVPLAASGCTSAQSAANTPLQPSHGPTAEWIDVDAPSGHRLRAAVFKPSNTEGAPIVLVLHGDDGFMRTYVDLGSELSAAGAEAVVGCWFSDRAPGVRTLEQPLECPAAAQYDDSSQWNGAVAALIQATQHLASVPDTRIGVLGNSGGAEQAIVSSVERPEVGAVVAISVPQGGDVPTPRVPLLLIQGNYMEGQAVIQNATKKYYQQVQNEHIAPVEFQEYEGRYSFLTVDPVTRADAVTRSVEFLKRTLAHGVE